MWEIARIFGLPLLFAFLLWHALRDQGVSWFRKSFLRSTSPVGYWLTVALYTGFLLYFVSRAISWTFLQNDDCVPNSEEGIACTITIPALEPVAGPGEARD